MKNVLKKINSDLCSGNENLGGGVAGAKQMGLFGLQA